MGLASTLSQKAVVMVDNHETVSEYLAKTTYFDSFGISFFMQDSGIILMMINKLVVLDTLRVTHYNATILN